MKPYVVRQGDHLQKLAHRMGFSAQEIWDHPKNKELKALRKQMNVLCPGDILFVPEERTRLLPFEPQSKNRYRLPMPKVAVSVAFRHDGKALANAPYRVVGLTPELRGSSDGEGRVKLAVPVHVRELRVVFPQSRVSFAVRIGDLDPVEEMSGVRARLRQLGLYPDRALLEALAAGDEEGEQAIDRLAIEAFQEGNGLAPTGELDGATRAALLAEHGS